MGRRTHGEGSVYMRKDGRAAASIMYEGKRITKYGKTKKEAREKLDAYLDELKQGKIVIGPKQTIEQYLTHWLEKSRRLRVRLTTLDRYRSVLRAHLIPAFGHLQLSELTGGQVQAFYAELLDRGLSPARIKFIHSVFSSALRDAVRAGVLARNVCEGLTVPRLKSYQAHALTKEECGRLIAAARGHRLWLFILMAVTIGARSGELLALRWSDIDIAACQVHIRRTLGRVDGVGRVENEPKTMSGLRKVRLPQVVMNALEEQRAYIARIRSHAGSAWVDRDLLFPNRLGDFLEKGVVRLQFQRILRKAGLPDMHIHDLRHSAATLLLVAGVNAKVVQEILGHSDIRVTLGMYGHVMPGMQQQAVDKMDDMFL